MQLPNGMGHTNTYRYLNDMAGVVSVMPPLAPTPDDDMMMMMMMMAEKVILR